jgi:MmyB-like transcription regulator ligand binding domain
MLDDLSTTPAFAIGPLTEVLGWNPLAAALFTDFGKVPEKDRYFIKLLFTDPGLRTRYADWAAVARLAIDQMRMASARYPGDPRLAALVGELSVRDAQFRQWWAARQVNLRSSGVKKLRHPLAGELTLDWNALSCATEPDQQIIVWTAPPGTPSHDALRLLASWIAGPDRERADR